MRIREALSRDLARALPPVVHLAAGAERLEAEASEYVLTTGVARQLGRLLEAIAASLEAGGESLPACWLSGPFGSGKSSLARLLGHALDGARLPSGRSLADALSAKAEPELARSLERAFERIDRAGRPLVVLFDVATMGRAGEGLHEIALRAARARLGRGRASPPASKPASKRHAPAEVAEALSSLLDQRAPGRTLWLVADEVGQHIGDDRDRALALQGLVASLGALGGRVWIVACGQQPLEAAGALSAVSDRFPARYRVALSPAEASEVLAARLLKKTPGGERVVRAMLEEHQAEVALRAAGPGEPAGERASLELYPFPPAMVSLLARVSGSLGAGAAQGGAAAPRALLQIAWSMLGEGGLGDRPVGAFATLDAAVEALGPSLPQAAREPLGRALSSPEVAGSALASRMVRALSVLGLSPGDEPAEAESISRWIWPGPGSPDERPQVQAEADRLVALGHLALSGRRGYRLEDERGRAWARYREGLEVPEALVSERVRAALAEAVRQAPRPRLAGRALPWASSLIDAAGAHHRLLRPSSPAPVLLELRLLGASASLDRGSLAAESEGAADRLLWVARQPDELIEAARAATRSSLAVSSAEHEGALADERARELLADERLVEASLASRLGQLVDQALLSGEAFFRGRPLVPGEHGASFGPALGAVGETIAPDLYPRFQPAPARKADAELLLSARITAPPAWMLPSGIGLVSDDGGAFVASCEGVEPRALLSAIGPEGEACERLCERLAGPPFGWGLDLVRACLAALLRVGAISLQLEGGLEIRTALDPGARDALLDDRSLRRARVVPAASTASSPTPRDRVAVASLLEAALGRAIDRDDEALADGVFALVREASARVPSPAPSPEPPWLPPLRSALEACREARSARATVLAARRHERALREGLEGLSSLASSEAEAAPFELALSGRVLRSRDELRALLQEIERRAGEAIDRGEAIRLR